ncbi:non-ribosomal peptide synthetase [Clostridium sp. C8-1-8]|uniref:non-ribosomal peptide synthetase n=1 Tax=Clostridium sp. C8-1-8 TaxID=2698831 RepID=UPI001368C9DE|nr:non-ribosomal peptide synthetase [Clostridium sp. C8-1-8]
MKNILDVFIDRAKGENSITFVIDENKEETISLKNIYLKALKLLYSLQQAGVEENDEIIFQIEDNRNYIISLWACMLGGIIPVYVNVGNNSEQRLKLFRIWRQLKNPHLITDNSDLKKLEDCAIEYGLCECMEEILSNTYMMNIESSNSGLGKIKKRQGEDIALIQFSSGSTGDPKGVLITHDNLVSNIDAMIERTKTSSEDSFLSWMPLNHNMGMIGFHLFPLKANSKQVIMETSLFLKDPTIWLDKINKHKSTHIISPNFGYKYLLSKLTTCSKKSWDFSNVRLIFNGGEPISTSLSNDFTEALKAYGLSANSMYPVYGMSEATLAICFPSLEEKMRILSVDRNHINTGSPVRLINNKSDFSNALEFASVGSPLSCCAVRIVDDSNNILEENFVGNIQIKGKNVTRGYYNSLEMTKKVIDQDGWLNTGDIGFLNNGQVIVTGRAKDIIFINGRNYYPYDIERVVEQVDGVEDGKVIACGAYNSDNHREEVIIFVQTEYILSNFAPLALKIKGYIATNMGINVADVIPVSSFHKTGSGKVQRYIMSEIYSNGEFKEISEQINKFSREFLNKENIEEARNDTEGIILSVCKKILGVPVIDVNENLVELGLDSILIPQICNELDKYFPKNVSVAQILAHPSVVQLSQYIDNFGSKETRDKTIYKLFDKVNEDDFEIDEFLDALDKK